MKNTGDFVTTFVGDTSVIVVRDSDGELYAFENRCAHRGALIALESRGNTKASPASIMPGATTGRATSRRSPSRTASRARAACPPRSAWSSTIRASCGLAEAFGIVFGSFSNDVPPLEEHLGEEIYSRIGRVMGGRTPVVLGRYTQALPNNWKLYMENVKDSYHASILHLFFTTFELNRLSQTGGIIVDPSGGHHISFSAIDTKRPRRTTTMPSRTSAPTASSSSPIPRCCKASRNSPTM